MEALVEQLMEELNCETVFTIPVLGGIPVSEAVVVSWIIMAVLFLLCIIFVRGLNVTHPGRKQIILETAVSGIYRFFDEILGEEGRAYVPYLMSVAVYVGMSNLIGLFGFKPPTKDLNVTAALALMSIILIEVSGFRKKEERAGLRALPNRFLLYCRSISWKCSSNRCRFVCGFLEMCWGPLSSWN